MKPPGLAHEGLSGVSDRPIAASASSRVLLLRDHWAAVVVCGLGCESYSVGVDAVVSGDWPGVAGWA